MPKEIWQEIRNEAREIQLREPILGNFLTLTIFNHDSFFSALAHYLSEKLDNTFLSHEEIQVIFLEAIVKSAEIQKAAIEDLIAIRERDPASVNYLNPFLSFKGYHALESYRVTNWLWKQKRYELASLLQSQISRIYGVDIHPAAIIGHGIFIDHASSIVIGETAVVGNDVSLLHEVTLGGTGKVQGDRHPKVGNGVLIGAGAKILGNVTIGDCAKIGAGSVVLTDIPPHTTAVGVPAQITGSPPEAQPSRDMNQTL